MLPVVLFAAITLLMTGLPAVAQNGTISGTVRDDNGNPLSAVGVYAYAASTGTFAASSSPTGSAGTYSLSIAPGTYRVKTSNSTSYVDEVYDNVPCLPSSCTVTQTGTDVVVLPGTATTGVDFALSRSGKVAGTVTDGAGTPLSGVRIAILAPASSGTYFATVATTTTGPNGAYQTSTTLVSGDAYRVTANGAIGYVSQLHDGLPYATGTAAAAGTPVSVRSGTTTQVDFRLAVSGRIAGVVKDASGNPLAGVGVRVYNAAGSFTASTTTDSLGAYVVALDLLTGSYFVSTQNSLGYVDEMYDDQVCVSCAPSSSMVPPVAVVAGQTTQGIDFALDRGGQIAGSIKDSVTGQALSGFAAQFLDGAGRVIGIASVKTDGTYTSAALPPGNYYVKSSRIGSPYVMKIYPNVECGLCLPSDGDPVAVQAGATSGPIDLALTVGGRIAGRVVDASTLAPVTGVTIWVYGRSGADAVVGATTDSNGNYVTGGIPAGTYYVKAGIPNPLPSAQGYVPKVFPDVACVYCTPPLVGGGITVSAGATSTGIDFSLMRGAQIAGTVRAEGTLEPVAGVMVQIFDVHGRTVASGITGATGSYTNPSGLTAGTYYAKAASAGGYLSRLYSNLECSLNCAATAGTPITVPTSGVVDGIDFVLSPGGRIAGRITEGDSRRGVWNASVSIWTNTGESVSAGTSVARDGTFVTKAALPAGSYFVTATSATGHVRSVYPGIDCLHCDLTAVGTAVPVTVGAITSGVDLALRPGGLIRGLITAADGVTPLNGVPVLVYRDGESPATYVDSATSGFNGIYLTSGLPAGNYRIRTVTPGVHTDQVYEGVSCANDPPPTAGQVVNVVPGRVTTRIDFALAADLDADGDGIHSTVDTDNFASSTVFSTLATGGRVLGSILDRGGWLLSVSRSVDGRAGAVISGNGSQPAVLSVCGQGGAEEVVLGSVGQKVTIDCDPTTGSTTVKVIEAASVVQLRKTIDAVTTVVSIPAGQSATLGSPVVAAADNTEPLHVALLDRSARELGSFDLDVQESAEATMSGSGTMNVTAYAGRVNATIMGVTGSIQQGETMAFSACSPIAIDHLVASPSVLWPPNHKMVDVTIAPSVQTSCGNVRWRILSVTSSDTVPGGSGSTSEDWIIPPSGLTLKLRAERAGSGETGRRYVVTVEGVDDIGRQTASVTVVVPHAR